MAGIADPRRAEILDSATFKALRTQDPQGATKILEVLYVLPRSPPRSTLLRHQREGGGGGGVVAAASTHDRARGPVTQREGAGIGGVVAAASTRDRARRPVDRREGGGGGGVVGPASTHDRTRGPVVQREGGGGGAVDWYEASSSVAGRGLGRLAGAESSVAKEVLEEDEAHTEQFEPADELYRFGTVRTSPWDSIWKSSPLVLRDLELARAARVHGQRNLEHSKVLHVLKNHPGAVRYLQIDSSILPDNQIDEFCDVLANKPRVDELVLVNCQWPKHAEFPIDGFSSSNLHVIRLCFFNISDVVFNDNYTISSLDLACCGISTEDLYSLVYQCKVLVNLYVGFGEGTLRISSDSLQNLQVWRPCHKYVQVENAPKLRKILVGMEPSPKILSTRLAGKFIPDRVMVEMFQADTLTEACFALCHGISIDRVSMHKEVGTVLFPILQKLELVICYGVTYEARGLYNFLRGCINLRELILWSGNNAKLEGAAIDNWPEDWRVAFNEMKCFRSTLKSFTIKPSRDCPDDALNKAKSALQNIVKASPKVNISIEERWDTQ